MLIHGLVACLNYSDYLAAGIERWLPGLTTLTVVTSPDDLDTIELVEHYRSRGWAIAPVRTDLWTAGGAVLNKGRCLEYARMTAVPREDWLLMFDADIIPPSNWKETVKAAHPEPGMLYGCWRYDEHGKRIKDDAHGYGYFQLLHSADPIAQASPLIDIHWKHAGNADSYLMLRWRNAGKLAAPLPLHLVHPGGPSHNWFGRGKTAEFEAMENERFRRGGGWGSIQHEAITL